MSFRPRLGAIIFAGALLAVSGPAMAQPGRLACEIAVAVLSEAVGKTPNIVVVGIGRAGSFAKRERGRHPPADLKPPSPPARLVRAWLKAPDEDVLQCAEVRALLAAKSIPYGEAAAKAVTEDPKTRAMGPWRATIYALGLPVIAPNRREAVVEIGVTCGGLCGNGALISLRRTKDGWKPVGGLPLWIS